MLNDEDVLEFRSVQMVVDSLSTLLYEVPTQIRPEGDKSKELEMGKWRERGLGRLCFKKNS